MNAKKIFIPSIHIGKPNQMLSLMEGSHSSSGVGREMDYGTLLILSRLSTSKPPFGKDDSRQSSPLTTIFAPVRIVTTVQKKDGPATESENQFISAGMSLEPHLSYLVKKVSSWASI